MTQELIRSNFRSNHQNYSLGRTFVHLPYWKEDCLRQLVRSIRAFSHQLVHSVPTFFSTTLLTATYFYHSFRAYHALINCAALPTSYFLLFPGIFFRSLSNDLEKLESLSFVCYLPAGIKSPSLVCRGNPCWCNSTLPDGRLCWLGFFYALRTKCSKFVPNCFTTNITRWQNSLLSTAWNPSWWENSPRVAHHHVKRSS